MNTPAHPLISSAKVKKTSTLVFPKLAMGEAIVEDLIDDGTGKMELLPKTKQEDALKVKVPNWPESEVDYIIALTWDDVRLDNIPGAFHSIAQAEQANPDFKFELSVPATYWASVADGEDARFRLGYDVQPFPDDRWDLGPRRLVRIDREAPGGSDGALAKLQFPKVVEERRRILVGDFTSGLLDTEVKGYVSQQVGDQIVVTMTDGTNKVPIGPITVFSATDPTTVPLPLIDLQKLDDRKPITFTYQSTDRAGNVSLASVPHDTLELLLTDIPDLLPVPEVPGFDAGGDPPVLEADARAGVDVHVPQITSVAVGDEIVVLWGSQRDAPQRVNQIPPAPDPLMVLKLPYPLTSAETEYGPVAVAYELWRAGSLIGTSDGAANVEVDLRVPGGPDPDPETPGHDDLVPATIKGGSSGQDDKLDPEDVAAGAEVTIAWEGLSAREVLAEGDKLALWWGNQSPHPLDSVTAHEASEQLPIVRAVPAALLGAEPSGQVVMAYAVTRETETGGPENTSFSPPKLVEVLRADELPGQGGPLPSLEFTKLNGNGAIGREEAQRELPVRIAGYKGMAPGDVIVITVDGKRGLGMPEDPIPGFPVSGPSFRIEQHHIDEGEVVLALKRQYAYMVCRGHLHVSYTASNVFGSVAAAHQPTPVSVREAGQDNCPIPTQRF
ncbi:hypothetical protein EON09_13910 [Pseudomonas soli]|nr:MULTISPECIES: hypothetical protein [Pseudomonas]MEE1880485.1 hypothetical protein [Pseudomonas soli]NBK39610.1 hypothetical protein [Pseudomonas soli]WJO22950.1 hypothetical protein LU688_04980 [Pseudomonas soli]SEP82385.1 hypothetical protein SAMN05216230_101552 [Pseudomonas soli]